MGIEIKYTHYELEYNLELALEHTEWPFVLAIRLSFELKRRVHLKKQFH